MNSNFFNSQGQPPNYNQNAVPSFGPPPTQNIQNSYPPPPNFQQQQQQPQGQQPAQPFYGFPPAQQMHPPMPPPPQPSNPQGYPLPPPPQPQHQQEQPIPQQPMNYPPPPNPPPKAFPLQNGFDQSFMQQNDSGAYLSTQSMTTSFQAPPEVSFQDSKAFQQASEPIELISKQLDLALVQERHAFQKLDPFILIKLGLTLGALNERSKHSPILKTTDQTELLSWIVHDIKRAKVQQMKPEEDIRYFNSLFAKLSAPGFVLEREPEPEEKEKPKKTEPVKKYNPWLSPICRFLYSSDSLIQSLECVRGSSLHGDLGLAISEWKESEKLPDKPGSQLSASVHAEITEDATLASCWERLTDPMAGKVDSFEISPAWTLVDSMSRGTWDILSHRVEIQSLFQLPTSPTSEFLSIALEWRQSLSGIFRYTSFICTPYYFTVVGEGDRQSIFELVGIFCSQQGKQGYIESDEGGSKVTWACHFEDYPKQVLQDWIHVCRKVAFGLIPEKLLFKKISPARREVLEKQKRLYQVLDNEIETTILLCNKPMLIAKNIAEESKELEYCSKCKHFTPAYFLYCLNCQNKLSNEGKEQLSVRELMKRLEQTEQSMELLSRSKSFGEMRLIWLRQATWECFNCHAQMVGHLRSIEDANCDQCKKQDGFMLNQYKMLNNV